MCLGSATFKRFGVELKRYGSNRINRTLLFVVNRETCSSSLYSIVIVLPVNVMWPYIMNAGESSEFRELIFFSTLCSTYISLDKLSIFLLLILPFNSYLNSQGVERKHFFMFSSFSVRFFCFVSACRRLHFGLFSVVVATWVCCVHIPHFIATVISNRFANYISFNCLRLCILKHCVQHVGVSGVWVAMTCRMGKTGNWIIGPIYGKIKFHCILLWWLKVKVNTTVCRYSVRLAGWCFVFFNINSIFSGMKKIEIQPKCIHRLLYNENKEICIPSQILAWLIANYCVL